MQRLVAAGHVVQKAQPGGRGGVGVVAGAGQAGDQPGAVMGVQLAAAQFEEPVLHVEGAADFVKIGVGGRYARQVLYLFEQVVLGMAAAAFGNKLAHGGRLLRVMDAEQVLLHTVQHLVGQLLDGGGLVLAPDLAVPQHPDLLRIVVAHPVAVQVAEVPGVAGVVQAVGLAAGGCFGGWRLRCGCGRPVHAHAAQQRLHLIAGRGFLRQRLRAVRVVDVLAVGNGAVQRDVAVGIGAAALVPLFAVEPARAEGCVHAGLVGPQPEGQQVAQGKVCLAVAGSVGLPVARQQGGQLVAAFGLLGYLENLGVALRPGRPGLHRAGLCSCGRGGLGAVQVLPVDLRSFGRALCQRQRRVVPAAAGHGKVAASVVHFQPHAAAQGAPAGLAGLFAAPQDVQPGAAGADLGIALHGVHDVQRRVVHDAGGGVDAVVQVDAGESVAQHKADAAAAQRGDRCGRRGIVGPCGRVGAVGSLAGLGVNGQLVGCAAYPPRDIQ